MWLAEGGEEDLPRSEVKWRKVQLKCVYNEMNVLLEANNHNCVCSLSFAVLCLNNKALNGIIRSRRKKDFEIISRAGY